MCTSLRKKGCCGLAVVVRAVYRIALAESQSFRWHLRYATDGYSTLVVEVSDDDDNNDGEEDVDDGERLHYDDASWRARYIL